MRKYWPRFRKLFGIRTSEKEESARSGFVDIHCHIIPAIDDGPALIEEVVEMLRKAHAGGTREMVATPHMFLELFDNTDPEVVKHAFEDTLRRLGKRAESAEDSFLNEMAFFPGAENYLSREFLDALENNAVLTINDSRYVLIESPPYLSVVQMRHTIQRVLESGFLPIIAHPERYLAFQERPHQMSEFVQWGCVVQINAGSLLGIYGRRVKKTSWALLKKDLAHVIASDNHGATVKSHDLGAVYPELKGRFRETKLEGWLRRNAGAIIRNQPIVRA